MSLFRAIALDLARHGLTAIGAFLVAHGWLTGAESNAAIGAVTTLAGIGWQAWHRCRMHASSVQPPAAP